MSLLTIEQFKEINSNRTNRVWQYEAIAESCYHAFTYKYEEAEVRTMKDMVLFWGYIKFLLDMHVDPGDQLADA